LTPGLKTLHCQCGDCIGRHRCRCGGHRLRDTPAGSGRGGRVQQARRAGRRGQRAAAPIPAEFRPCSNVRRGPPTSTRAGGRNGIAGAARTGTTPGSTVQLILNNRSVVLRSSARLSRGPEFDVTRRVAFLTHKAIGRISGSGCGEPAGVSPVRPQEELPKLVGSLNPRPATDRRGRQVGVGEPVAWPPG